MYLCFKKVGISNRAGNQTHTHTASIEQLHAQRHLEEGQWCYPTNNQLKSNLAKKNENIKIIVFL